MVQSALIVAITFYIVQLIDFTVGWQTLTRPIVIAPIIGLVLGDFRTGIMMGAALESMFMGISAIGGVIPADPASSSAIAVAFTILTGATTETGLALAMPIGLFMTIPMAFLMPLFSAFSPAFESFARNDQKKKFEFFHILQGTVGMYSVGAVIMFLAIAFGVEQLGAVMAGLPGWLIAGLGASSGMLMAVGFGMLTSMIWSPATGAYFFAGFVLAKYLGLTTVPITILGVVIALAVFFRDKQIQELKLRAASPSTGEEDFF